MWHCRVYMYMYTVLCTSYILDVREPKNLHVKLLLVVPVKAAVRQQTTIAFTTKLSLSMLYCCFTMLMCD